jgi:hypothetical protein
MKNLLMTAVSLFILSGTGLAMADEAIVQTKPLVADVNTDANVSANTNMASGKTDVNETDKIEINKASLRDNDVNINMARKDVIRDDAKLKDDMDKLADAQSAKDDQAIATAKTDVENDKNAVGKDRERLKKHLGEKIENDKVIVRKFDDKIRDARKDVTRDSEKLSADTDKLADAQKRYATDEIDKKKADVENDKTVVNDDTTKLNQRIADKAEYVVELKNDRRHLDAVEKHLSEEDQVSVTDNTSAESSDSAAK